MKIHLRAASLGMTIACGTAIAGCARATAPQLTPAVANGASFVRSASTGYKTLHSFGNGNDGNSPSGSLINVGGTLYGTSGGGGAHGGGTVFRAGTTGGERSLHSFGNGKDGAFPSAALLDVDGTLYGTTIHGGKNRAGTVFSSSATGREHVLHDFGKGSDGSAPRSTLIEVKGTFYGTTSVGGTHGKGTVFSITPTGTERVLYRFGGRPDGAFPYAGLIAVKGMLYGTTSEGGRSCTDGTSGPDGCGTIFSVNPRTGEERVLHRFVGGVNDGSNPWASLINLDGTLYGTTSVGGDVLGGQNACTPGGNGGTGCGSVFAFTISTGKESLIYRFNPDGTTNGDGMNPVASLVEDATTGLLYGTTLNGGAYEQGTVFSVDPSGSEAVLHSFGAEPDGLFPFASLLDVQGTLYGTTSSGGDYYYQSSHGGAIGGTIFALTL